MEDEAYPVGVHRHIAGSKLPGYEDYCPITLAYVFRQEDGRYRLDDYDDPSGEVFFDESDFIDNPGFLILHLGHAVEREHTVETAARALHSTLTSLFAACNVPVTLERIRTSIEFSEFMKAYRAEYSHLILIGHGSTDGIRFLDKPAPVKGAELAGMLGADSSANNLQILSLCCHSGCEAISKALSVSEGVTEVIAPSEAFDMRWASHFVTGYFLSRYVSNRSSEEAVQDHCRASKMGVCIWRDGKVLLCQPDQEEGSRKA
jgi:hypothetical protein